MGKMVEHPRYRVVSFRVTDEEHAAIREARELGLTLDGMRNLVLYGARCFTSNPLLPCASVTLPTSSNPSGSAHD